MFLLTSLPCFDISLRSMVVKGSGRPPVWKTWERGWDGNQMFGNNSVFSKSQIHEFDSWD